jgi:hypothetical protein
MPPKLFVNALEVSAYLNLYGLTPYQFRLFAHISRRSQKDACSSSLEKMAVVCGMGARTAQDALSQLVKNNMVQKKARYNETNLMRVVHDVTEWVVPSESWKDKDLPNNIDLIFDRERALENFATQQKSLLEKLKKKKKAIFVHGFLDLYGLDPYDFRVLAHISCNELNQGSVETMAAICMMSPRKVQTTLTKLLHLNLVKKTVRPGRVSEYETNNLLDWKEPEHSWVNKRTIARLKNNGDRNNLNSEDNETLLKNYKGGLQKVGQDLSEEFATIVALLNKQQREFEEPQKKLEVNPSKSVPVVTQFELF